MILKSKLGNLKGKKEEYQCSSSGHVIVSKYFVLT